MATPSGEQKLGLLPNTELSNLNIVITNIVATCQQ